MRNNLPVPRSAPGLPAVIPARPWYDEVPRSIGRLAVLGILLMMLTIGGFSTWAFTAPLAAAVIAQGSFVANGQNKIIQHLEGGIIEAILVQEGQFVKEGASLLTLDETSARADERELFLRRVRLEATATRLLAEYQGDEVLRMPEHLMAVRSDTEVAPIIEGQMLAFKVAQSALANDISLLQRNIDALGIRASGYEIQLESHRTQIAIFDEELAAKTALLEKGLTRRTEINAVKRAMAEATGQIGRLDAEIAEIEQIRLKYDMQIEKAVSEHRQVALDELQVIEAELESIREQSRKAQNVLNRAVVTAPVDGTIVRLHFHTPSGVIESGDPIMEILPADAPLIVEVQIPRTDIDSVHVGQAASVRLSALNQRTTPVLDGEVIYVSADSVADQQQRNPEAPEVYVARVTLPPEELHRVRGFVPTPGMPAEVLIQTEERTFAQYIAKPITDSMSRAFREQ